MTRGFVEGQGVSARGRRRCVVWYAATASTGDCHALVPPGVDLVIAPDLDALGEVLDRVDAVVIEAEGVSRASACALEVSRGGPVTVPVVVVVPGAAAAAVRDWQGRRPDLVLAAATPLDQAHAALLALIVG